jgi:hypothetical protein
MKILSFDYDLEMGFAWIMIDGKYEDEELIVQCCLSHVKGGNYERKINASDCGHNWGSCGDANGDAFDYYGENRCMKALFAKAKENGFIVLQ